MTRAETVVGVGHGEPDPRRLVRFEGLWFLEAVTELAADHVATDQLLVTTHADFPGIFGGVGVVVRVDVDQLDDPVAVGPGGRNQQINLDRSDQRHVLFQFSGLVDQHVGPP